MATGRARRGGMATDGSVGLVGVKVRAVVSSAASDPRAILAHPLDHRQSLGHARDRGNLARRLTERAGSGQRVHRPTTVSGRAVASAIASDWPAVERRQATFGRTTALRSRSARPMRRGSPPGRCGWFLHWWWRCSA